MLVTLRILLICFNRYGQRFKMYFHKYLNNKSGPGRSAAHDNLTLNSAIYNKISWQFVHTWHITQWICLGGYMRFVLDVCAVQGVTFFAFLKYYGSRLQQTKWLMVTKTPGKTKLNWNICCFEVEVCSEITLEYTL